MSYREDVDLMFLEKIEDEDLDLLVYVLTHDFQSNKPSSNSRLIKHPDFIEHKPKHSKYWKEIAAEIQLAGANSISTFFRKGYGVYYREVLCDVCDKLNIPNNASKIDEIEACLLENTFKTLLENMSDEEKKVFLGNLNNIINILGSKYPNILVTYILSSIYTASLTSSIIGAVGVAGSSTLFLASRVLFPFAGLGFALGPLIATSAPFVLFSLFKSSMQNYNITTPACVLIANLRAKSEFSAEDTYRIKKYDDLVSKLQDDLNSYKESDFKCVGLYILLSEMIKHCKADIDADTFVFGFNRDLKMRVLNIVKEKKLSVNSIEEAKDVARKCLISDDEISNYIKDFNELLGMESLEAN